MGNYKIKISFSLSLLLLVLVLSIFMKMATAEVPPINPPLPQRGLHSLRIKKRLPPFLNKEGDRRKRNSGRSRREKMAAEARRFSAMLPKGYVPPSGSSPCHNVYPNSVSFFCDYSNQMQKP